MCGLILLSGNSSNARIAESLQRINHRGPDDQISLQMGQTALGFARLAINGDGVVGKQPYTSGQWIAAINGEIYNYRELASDYDLDFPECDTHIVLPLFDKLRSQIIDELDGFYAGVIFNRGSCEVYCLRDHIGKKPLFVGASRGDIFITSELKVLDSVDWFEAIPLGISKVDLLTGHCTLLKKHSAKPVAGKLSDLLSDSVQKRMPRFDQPVGVFLSGGLDSSLMASYVSRLRDDAIYFVLGENDSSDSKAVKTVVKALGLKDVREVRLPKEQELPKLLNLVVHATESYNPSVISNGLATYLLAQAAREAGVKVILTGEGADELFGGYHQFQQHQAWRETRKQLIQDMQFTELRRLDLACMAHSIEARCPFLDVKMKAFSNRLDFHQLYNGNENKVTLRQSFVGYLPAEILHRRKTSCDVGSGIRGMVVRYLKRNGRSERTELLALWEQIFGFDALHPYFHQYRVFDQVIDSRGECHR